MHTEVLVHCVAFIYKRYLDRRRKCSELDIPRINRIAVGELCIRSVPEAA